MSRSKPQGDRVFVYLDEQNHRLRLTKAAGLLDLPTIWGPPRFTLWDLGHGSLISVGATPWGAPVWGHVPRLSLSAFQSLFCLSAGRGSFCRSMISHFC